MTDDIVTRLRHVSWLAEEGSEVVDLAAAAADEIMRLHAANQSLQRQIFDCLESSIVMTANPPCDWDGQSYCSNGCGNHASHTNVVGMMDATAVVELVCCTCSHKR